jgi:hypothetical protein
VLLHAALACHLRERDNLSTEIAFQILDSISVLCPPFGVAYMIKDALDGVWSEALLIGERREKGVFLIENPRYTEVSTLNSSIKYPAITIVSPNYPSYDLSTTMLPLMCRESAAAPNDGVGIAPLQGG